MEVVFVESIFGVMPAASHAGAAVYTASAVGAFSVKIGIFNSNIRFAKINSRCSWRKMFGFTDLFRQFLHSTVAFGQHRIN